MYFRILEKNALKYSNLTLLIFYQHLDQHSKNVFKKTEVKLELLTDVDILLMVGKGIMSGMCHTIH